MTTLTTTTTTTTEVEVNGTKRHNLNILRLTFKNSISALRVHQYMPRSPQQMSQVVDANLYITINRSAVKHVAAFKYVGQHS